MTDLQHAALEALATLDLIESVGAAHYVFAAAASTVLVGMTLCKCVKLRRWWRNVNP